MPPPGFGRAFFAAPGYAHTFYAGPLENTFRGPQLTPNTSRAFRSHLEPFEPTLHSSYESSFAAATPHQQTAWEGSLGDLKSSAAELSSTESASSSCAASSSSVTTVGGTPDPEPPSSDVITVPRATELELLHHYEVEGHKSLVHTYNPEAEADSLFRDDIPRLAFSHDFLLDSILSVSAFHLAYVNRPTERGALDWTTIALHYHQRSVRSLRVVLGASTREELQKQYTGLLYGATFIGIASFFSMQQPHRASFIDSVRALASMMKGTASIHKLDDGGFEALRGKQKPVIDSEHYILAPDIETALHELRAHAVQQDAITKHQEWDGSYPVSGTSYVDTVSRLRECFVACDRGNEIEGGTAWPALSMPNFTSHMELQDPVSHLIVLVLGVLWGHLHERWWARDVGKCAVEEMSSMEVLKDQQYQSLVLWARRKVGIAVW